MIWKDWENLAIATLTSNAQEEWNENHCKIFFSWFQLKTQSCISRYDEAYPFLFICEDIYLESVEEKYHGYDLKSDMLLRNTENFTRYDWMKNQSFCWKNKEKVNLMQRLTKAGICFVLNGNEKLLRDERWNSVPANFLNNETFSFLAFPMIFLQTFTLRWHAKTKNNRIYTQSN